MLTTQPAAPNNQRFKLDRDTQGSVTRLSLSGVIDEGLEGKKLGESIKTPRIVLDLRDVRRFASWGMAEWAEFLRLNETRHVYVVECSAQALSQFNLVTGLLGHARLLSFYVPYRCSKCSEESERLLVLPADRNELHTLEDSALACVTCGGLARIDKYLLTTLAAIAERPTFDVDDDVIGYLRDYLKYDIKPDLSRSRAHRTATKDYTYLRLSGNLSGLPSQVVAAACDGTTVVDLANIQPLDASGQKAWRNFLTVATPRVKALQLYACPSGMLETALTKEDFDKVKVRSFTLVYECTSCGASTPELVDVASQLEYLVMGTLPLGRCSQCKATVEPLPSMELLDIVRRLPARENDVALDKFLDKARTETNDKLEDASVPRAEKVVEAPAATTPKALYVAIGLVLVAVAGVGVLALTMWRDRGGERRTSTDVIVPPKLSPTYQRPDWIVSDLPLSAFCQETETLVRCVGVSSYRATRDEGVADASDAALDELATTLGLKIASPVFRDLVLSQYADPRAKALTALQDADVDRTSDVYKKASATVRDARKRVTESLRASGGPAVPATRSDWYWEEYALEKGSGTEALVFVRYDLTTVAVQRLLDAYSTEVDARGAKVLTAFPALAWRHSSPLAGAMVVDGGRLFADAVTKGEIITEVDGTPITDAASLVKALEQPAAKAKAVTLGADARDVSLRR